MTRININLSELPEATTNDGVKVYGTTSYETQIAILSHYLHTLLCQILCPHRKINTYYTKKI